MRVYRVRTVTAFLLGAAEEKARAVLENRRHVVMSERAFRELASSLDGPPEKVAPIKDLFELPRIDSR